MPSQLTITQQYAGFPNSTNNTKTTTIPSTKATKTTKTGVVKKKGGRGDAYNFSETGQLLMVMRDILPISAAEWDQVKATHDTVWSEKCRSIDT